MSQQGAMCPDDKTAVSYSRLSACDVELGTQLDTDAALVSTLAVAQADHINNSELVCNTSIYP